MPDLADGESAQMQGSGSKPYELKNTGGVYSCSCPAWRNQSIAIERRTCKHLKKLRGEAAEVARVTAAGGGTPPPPPAPKSVARAAALAKAAPVLLAESWDGVLDPAGWWMSEKLDGIRAYWDGARMWSRLGNEFHVPEWFVEGLPKHPLDGELFLARKAFQKTTAIVRRQDKSEHWKQIRFLIFDAPGHGGAFEARLEMLAKLAATPFAEVHAHARCTGVEHLKAELARVEALGGEGLMLRQAGSVYVAGRSSTLLKVKSFKDDEAIVIGHQPGAGRHKGRLGALLVRLADGTEFAIGTGLSDKQREDPPAVGATVVFRYQELSDGGVPRFPTFHGVRDDV
ncbi:MAG TPA: DNA ligase [Tepidisphaeraceae bacterium]|nr:DNA ligase [Tepidisphaeraceae bacterium]